MIDFNGNDLFLFYLYPLEKQVVFVSNSPIDRGK